MVASRRLRTLPALACALLVAALLALAGCGDDPGEAVSTAPDRAKAPDASLAAAISMPGSLGSLDPLFSSTRAGRLISRQIHEPLVSSLDAPFASSTTLDGPGRVLPPTGRGTKWRVRLRPGVRFQDGSPLDFEAVQANFGRWLSSDIGARLLPGVAVVDSPQPGVVRFQFSRTTPDFPSLIRDPRLGLVSPLAIAEAAGGRVRGTLTGTGPYELRERRGDSALLGRNSQWWGTGKALGPGVGRLEFGFGSGSRLRFAQLRSGAVQIADALSELAVRRVARDPLLATIGRRGDTIGVERSVRGIDSLSGRQSLSELWLTDLP